jgi:hypothetical protein
MSRARAEHSRLYGRTFGSLVAVAALSACTQTLEGQGAGNGTSGTGGGSSGSAGATSGASGASSSGSSGTGPGTGGTTSPPDDVDCATRPVDPGPSPMRLLSRAQYQNTVRDLVGDVSGLEAALGPAVEASAFGLVQPDVTQVELESFQAAADVIAAAIVGDADRLDELAPCAADAEPLDCARSFVETFGARAYRAPLADPADVERHLALFNAGLSTSYAHGVELLLRGILQAPRFLYRVEIGTAERVSETAIKLGAHEIAARLSYTLWGTLPDARLTEAIVAGRLATKEGVAAELAWMLENPRGGALVRRFLESLIHVGDVERVVKDETAHPEWQEPALRAALRGQAERFFDHVLGVQGGRLPLLFTSQTVFVNAALGDYYGVTGTDEFQPFERNDGTAAGLLTLPALLSIQAKPAESSPIYRGKFVREVLLCQALPAPPANVPRPPEVQAGVSTRERLAQHEVDLACSGCHSLIDPVGFGFEHFDAIGRYRTEDGGKPVDASGELVDTRDIDGPFVGVVELGQKLAESAEVEECIARQWFRYALGRFEQEMDVCSVKRLFETFRAAELDLNVLPRAVVETDAFMYRRPLE